MHKTRNSESSLTVVHVIGGLEKGGGAEEMLYRLILANGLNTHVVISLQGADYYGTLFEERSIEVICLNLSKSPLSFIRSLRILTHLHRIKPDVVQTWMYYSDLIGGLGARAVGIRNVCWGIHHSTMDSVGSSRSSRIFAKICARVSNWLPASIISCSNSGARAHEGMGYSSKKMQVVHNGYDLNEFYYAKATPDAHPDSLRTRFNIAKEATCLGMVARFDPQKDHANLLASLAALSAKGYNDWVCFLFGRGIKDNTELLSIAQRLDIENKVIFYGLSTDISQQLRQLDIHVLSSRFGEAFPNVLNEAMASGVPCITTDIGDASTIVGKHGWVVPPSDPEAIAAALVEAIEEMKNAPEARVIREKSARRHIENNFSIEIMVAGYEKIWRNMINAK